MTDSKLTSIEIGRAALKIAVTGSRSEEQRIKQELAEQGIRSTAVDFGGEFIPSLVKIVCLLYTSPSPRDRTRSRMPSSA